MLDSIDRSRVASLLTDAITTLCRKGLSFESEFTVEGLLGITLDNKDIFLVNIKEIVKNCDIVSNGQNEAPQYIDTSDAHTHIMHKPEDIFPKRRKKRKSSTVSKRKISFPGLESPPFDNIMDSGARSAPSAISYQADDVSPVMCEDLSVKDSKRSLADIPGFSDTDYNMPISYDDGFKDHASDISNHSNGVLPKEDSDQFGSFQQSPRISFGDGFGIDFGLGQSDTNHFTSDWHEAVEMPLNLSEVKQVEVREMKKYACAGCGKNYKTEYSFKKHKCKNGSLSEPSSLGHETTQPLDLTKHVNLRDGLEGGSLPIDLDLDADPATDEGSLLSEQYSCICSRSFADYTTYAEHIASCYKAKLTPYKACDICGKYFFSNSGYVKHKRLHVGAYKFHCDICRKGFFDRTHLRAHMDSSHSKVRRYECVHCLKSFFWKHHLKRHLGTCDKAKGSAALEAATGETPSPADDLDMAFQPAADQDAS